MSAWGKDGYVREGLAEATHGIGRVLFKVAMVVIIVVGGYLLVKWALTEYYITTHCTTVAGTRVCQQ